MMCFAPGVNWLNQIMIGCIGTNYCMQSMTSAGEDAGVIFLCVCVDR